MRLLLDSRVVDVTMASNPIGAACILLETLIVQELYPCVVCCRHPREQKTLQPNKRLGGMSGRYECRLISSLAEARISTPNNDSILRGCCGMSV